MNKCVDDSPRWYNESIEFSDQVSSDNALGRWNAKRGRHSLAGERRLKYDETAVNSTVYCNKIINNLIDYSGTDFISK